MKTLDIVHTLPEYDGRGIRGLYRVRVFAAHPRAAVLLTDLGEMNDGQSVTNAVECIIDSLVDQGSVIPPAIFIEHYEREVPELDSFDKVNLEPRTSWESLTRDAVLKLTGADASELNDRSRLNRRIVRNASQVRYRREPFADSLDLEPNEVVQRRLEIKAGMVSKSSFFELIDRGASEREIQKLMKADLSLLGEAYAKPDDEYISFAEYPLADGSVDFVVFTGRSRMDIVLIEVKGADFNLVNANHYGAFNHKVTEAAGQIQSRLGSIFRDLHPFRKEAHARRLRAERGENVHQAFRGPYWRLQVDPNKDVNIRSVVIGGRTLNDLDESRKRQDYEARFSPPVRIESWDTWLRRLQRE